MLNFRDKQAIWGQLDKMVKSPIRENETGIRFLYSYIYCQETIEHLEGIQQKTVWVKGFVSSQTSSDINISEVLLENLKQGSHEVAEKTFIKGLEISAHWHFLWISVDHWQAECVLLQFSCPTSYEMQ